jgi:hypothetical protein
MDPVTRWNLGFCYKDAFIGVCPAACVAALARNVSKSGLPDFFVTIYQNGENIPHYHKIYQLAIKYIKWP